MRHSLEHNEQRPSQTYFMLWSQGINYWLKIREANDAFFYNSYVGNKNGAVARGTRVDE